MLDVGQQQFLVLLFMVQPQLDELRQFALFCITGRGEGFEHALIDLCPVGQHVLQRRAADESPIRTRIFIAHAVVIAVEQHAKTGIERFELRL